MNKKLGSSLRIVYKITGRYEASYVSEFYKMCGFLVVEQEVPEGVAEYERIMEKADEYDHNLFLGIDDVDYESFFELDCENWGEKMCRLPLTPSFLNDYSHNNFLNLKKNLKKIVTSVLDYSSESLSRLISVFVEKKYFQLSYIKRYFGEAVGKEEQEWLYKGFLEIFRLLKNDEVIRNDKCILPYYLHAELLCARKVNDICGNLGINCYFNKERMIEECLSVLDYLPEFPSAYALAASFCSYDAVYRSNVIPFYEAALRGDDTSPALANIYYRLGQYYEKQREDVKKANQVYEKAMLISPHYFRALFKKGAELLDEKKYASSIQTYKEIIRILDCKRRYSLLFPVEYEYLCKCYLLIGLIYDYYWGDQWQGDLYYKQAVDLVEDELRDSCFFKDILSDKAGIYLKYLKNRIALRKHILVEKYR